MANTNQIARDLYNVRQQIKALTDQEKALKEALADLPLGKTATDDFIVSISETSRFNEAEATRNLPADVLQSISKMKPDSKLAKAMLSDEDYRISCCTQSSMIKVTPVTN